MTFHETSKINVCSINHKQLEFVTAVYAPQFLAMRLQTFDLGAGLENLLHLASLITATFLNLSGPDEKRKWRARGSLKKGN